MLFTSSSDSVSVSIKLRISCFIVVEVYDTGTMTAGYVEDRPPQQQWLWQQHIQIMPQL
jgi:hypothetical protein